AVLGGAVVTAGPPEHPGLVIAAAGGGRTDGGGSYDPLREKLRPGWLPDGWNYRSVTNTTSHQSISVSRLVRDPSDREKYPLDWDLTINLYRPHTDPVTDGPDHPRFGAGTRVDPVQGLAAEEMTNPNKDMYTLAWAYPSGAHGMATVTLGGTRSMSDAPEMARHAAETLQVDGTAQLRFPYVFSPPTGEHVTRASTKWTHFPGLPVTIDARVGFAGPREHSPWWKSMVLADSDSASYKTQRSAEWACDPHRHGFALMVHDLSRHAPSVFDSVRIFGSPRDMSDWRPNPVR
ncbi:MAG: hypothetical protein WCA46_11880, partial [Actinocatenispora sp.]